MVVIEDNCQSSDGDIAIIDECLRDVVDSPASGQFLLREDYLFGQVQQEHIATLITSQQVIMMLGERTEAGHILHIDRILREVLLNGPFVVPILLLLLDLVHAQVQPIKYGLLEHLTNQPVGLREEVLAVVGVADAPLIEIKLVHAFKLYYKDWK